MQNQVNIIADDMGKSHLVLMILTETINMQVIQVSYAV